MSRTDDGARGTAAGGIQVISVKMSAETAAQGILCAGDNACGCRRRCSARLASRPRPRSRVARVSPRSSAPATMRAPLRWSRRRRRRPGCLVSFGIAGALAPSCAPGDVILSAEVIDADRRQARRTTACGRGSPSWRAGSAPSRAPVLGARIAISTEADKIRTWTANRRPRRRSRKCGGRAHRGRVGHSVPGAARDRRPGQRDLPPAALLPLAADGTPGHRPGVGLGAAPPARRSPT